MALGIGSTPRDIANIVCYSALALATRPEQHNPRGSHTSTSIKLPPVTSSLMACNLAPGHRPQFCTPSNDRPIALLAKPDGQYALTKYGSNTANQRDDTS